MRVDKIQSIKDLCTGCMGCVDACPQKCVSKYVDVDGFIYTKVDSSKCIDCGKCVSVCPVFKLNKDMYRQSLFAAYAKDKYVHNRGSSGGVFEVIATYALDNGYYVCGAGFEGTQVKHKIVKNKNDLSILLKSKYVQSDTLGIYQSIKNLLISGEKVLFSGTPCQVSALKNYLPDKYLKNIILIDIVCHGVPSQKVFDMYIESLEKKCGGKISQFSFRVKDNIYKHSNGYRYTITKDCKSRIVNGVYSQSSFYNAFKNYLILRESCYRCRYATTERVSDITLGDFWGIDRYDFDGDNDSGVSLVITNSSKGNALYKSIKENLVSKEFSILHLNHCLIRDEVIPKSREKILNDLMNNGYEITARKYFRKNKILKPLFWLLPISVRKFLRNLRG